MECLYVKDHYLVCVGNLRHCQHTLKNISIAYDSHRHSHTCRSAAITIYSTDPPVLLDTGEVKLRENVDMVDPGSSPAYPIPSQVSWTKDGEEIGSVLPTRVFNYSSIFIGSVEPSDSGVYQLSITSYFLNGSLFQSDSAPLTLNVLCESPLWCISLRIKYAYTYIV